ncbi:hypothetical protein M885DRAFT_416576, partial [Pelagophyceae sp. CCMP2097]
VAKALTESEVARLRLAFAAADLDGSGTLTASEVEAAFLDRGVSAAEARDMIEKADYDGGGDVCIDEFLSAGMTADQFKRYQAVFDEVDDDGNGSLDAAELRRCLMKLGAKASERQAAKVLKRADLNGDSLVNFDEFL